MRCPFCEYENIPGIEFCEDCGADLAGLDLPEAGAGFGARLLTGEIGDLPLSPVLELRPDASVREAVDLMREKKHGCVLVVDGGKLVGIVTERDVLSRVVRPERDLDETQLQDVMTRRPSTLAVDDPPAFGVHLTLAQGFRHVPIVDRDRLAGFISVRNLLQHVAQDLRS